MFSLAADSGTFAASPFIKRPSVSNVDSGGSGPSVTTLTLAVRDRLAACAARFEKQAALPEHRRRRVGMLVRGASTAERLAIAAYFAHRLDLNIALLDAGLFEGVHENDAADYARPLLEDLATVALVEGLTGDLDERLCSALVRSSHSVLVVACAEGSELLDARLAKCFAFVVDCRAKVRSLPFVTALRV